MDRRQQSALGAFHRIQRQLDQHDDLLGHINNSEPRREFDWLVDALDHTAESQEEVRSRAIGQTSRKSEVRESVIVDHIQPIVSIIEMNRTTMLDISTLKVPSSSDNDFEVELRARTTITLASRHTEKFVRCGLPADFLEQLTACTDEFRALRLNCDFIRLERFGHTFAVDYHLKRGWVVYRVIKALARKALRQHPALLAEFRRAKLHRPRRALPATRLALQPGEAASTRVAVLAQPSAPAEQPARRPRISAWARVVGMLKPTE